MPAPGRRCPEEIIAIADTVTEMKLIKHAFQAGIPRNAASRTDTGRTTMHWHWFHPAAAHAGQGARLLALAVLVALAVDRLWGEPPLRWHPVVGWARPSSCWGTGRAQHAKYKIQSNFGLERLPGVLAAIVFVAYAACSRRWCWRWGALSRYCTAVVDMPGLALGGFPVVITSCACSWRRCCWACCSSRCCRWISGQEVRAVNAALDQSLEAGARAPVLPRQPTWRSSAPARCARAPNRIARRKPSTTRSWHRCSGLPWRACLAPRSTAWPTPPTPCGATAACMRGRRYWHWAGKWAAQTDDVALLAARAHHRLAAGTACPGPAPVCLLRRGAQDPRPTAAGPWPAMALALNVIRPSPAYRLHSAGRSPYRHGRRRAHGTWRAEWFSAWWRWPYWVWCWSCAMGYLN